jgi:hypothetical protein
MARKTYEPRPDSLSTLREHYEAGAHALAHTKFEPDSIGYRVLKGAVEDMRAELESMEREANQILIIFDTDADVLKLEARA